MLPIEWIQDEEWDKLLTRYLEMKPVVPLPLGTSFRLFGREEPKHPPRITEVGKNLYAPKVLIAIERSSYDCAAPMILEFCRDVFKEYEYGQVYYQKFEPNGSSRAIIEEAELVGARLFYFMYHAYAARWELAERGGLSLRIHVPDFQFTSDRRFVRRHWYEEKKPKVKEPCRCGLCDECLGLN